MIRNTTEAADLAAPVYPVGTLHDATFNYSGRADATGWDKAAQGYAASLRSLREALKHAGRSLDARVVSITAKLWRDRGGETVAARHAIYAKARGSLISTATTDPENMAGKVRLVAEMLGLPDPWRSWKDGLPPRGSREAEAFNAEAEALFYLYRDLRDYAHEVEALRKLAAKRERNRSK